jgi:ubiquinone/menaquinone biosynthesis C-methylase UbiE
MSELSVIIIAKNEEKKLSSALDSVRWADEIVFLDSGSADMTVEVAKRYTDRIYNREFDDFSSQKNFAISKCSNDWIFSIDCDEIVSDRLKEAIIEAIKKPSGCTAYKVKRINKIFGKILNHAAGDDYPVRLFKKDRAEFIQPIHEVLRVSGSIGLLDGELLHNSTEDIRSEYAKTDQYTELEAKWVLEKNSSFLLFRMLLCPLAVFFNISIVKAGILDGYKGLLYGFVSARYSFIKYIKALRLFKDPAYLENKISSKFNELHKQFPDTIDPDDARLKALLKTISDFDGRHILEVGCGKGRFIREVAKRNALCTGIDPSERFIQEAKAKNKCTFLKASATRLPFDSGAFDTVFSVEVIEHLPDLEGFFKEAARVLKDGGSLIIVDRNKFSINNRRFMAPNLLIKRYHEIKNEWMYPNNFPFRERWFNPGKVHALMIKYFNDCGYEYILSHSENCKWWHIIFKFIPVSRHFVLWHGKNKRKLSGC